MAPTRRRLLAAAVGTVGASAALGGCITDPGRSCSGATVRLSLTPVDAVEDPLVLDAGTLSTAANAVVEAAIEGEHVENCVTWGGSPGPSAGLREVGERLEDHLDVDLAERRTPVETDAVRGGDPYRLELTVERSR